MYFVFCRARSLRGVVSALIIRGVLACFDSLRGMAHCNHFISLTLLLLDITKDILQSVKCPK